MGMDCSLPLFTLAGVMARSKNLSGSGRVARDGFFYDGGTLPLELRLAQYLRPFQDSL